MSDFIWVEKYRPQTIEDCILPESIKKTFKDFLNTGEIPNLYSVEERVEILELVR